MNNTLIDKLIDAGCEQHEYHNQKETFYGKKYDRQFFCNEIGIPKHFIDYCDDIDPDKVVVEYCVEQDIVIYWLNQYCYDSVPAKTKAGKSLLSLLLKKESN